MRVVITGGTGLIGTALTKALLERGDAVVLVTRQPAAAQQAWEGRVEARLWNGRDPGPWVMAVDGADAVVNLAGESVADGRWSAERKLVLLKSRIDSTRAVVKALAAATDRPMAFVSASAVGYYGANPNGPCPEKSPGARAPPRPAWGSPPPGGRGPRGGPRPGPPPPPPPRRDPISSRRCAPNGNARPPRPRSSKCAPSWPASA